MLKACEGGPASWRPCWRLSHSLPVIHPELLTELIMPVTTRTRSSSTTRSLSRASSASGTSAVVAATNSLGWFKPVKGTIPIASRPRDVLFIIFFMINLFIITYVVDVEQITAPVAPPNRESFPYTGPELPNPI